MSSPGKHRVPPEVPPSPAPDPGHPRSVPGGGDRGGAGEPVRPGLLRGEIWLAIHLPHCILESLAAGNAGNRADADAVPGDATVVVDPGRGGKVVCARDAKAAAAGVVPGMACNSALALLPDARVLARDQRREHALLEAIARSAIAFTPRISLEPPDGVLLEVRGSLRLFGGVRPLSARVEAQLRERGVEPQIALAPTRLAALWFARMGMRVALRRSDALAGRLATLPLACTRWPEASLASLATMGVHTIGDCLRLPRDGVARRFEPRLLLDLDRALGRAADPCAAFVPGERFAAYRDLEFELADVELIGRLLEPLIEELCAFLRARVRGVQTIELRFAHRDLPATRLRLRFVEPVQQPGRITTLLGERLARLVLPAPVRRLRLQGGPLVEIREAPVDLFAIDPARAAGVPLLVERLRARLGDDAVHGVRPVPEHRPESAWCRWPDLTALSAPLPGAAGASGKRRAGRAAAGECSTLSLRPLWLLAEPQRLDGGEQPRYEGALELEQGPERVESGWWDGRDVRRDYFVARSPAGMRLWIFRERSANGGWFLHGVFG